MPATAPTMSTTPMTGAGPSIPAPTKATIRSRTLRNTRSAELDPPLGGGLGGRCPAGAAGAAFGGGEPGARTPPPGFGGRVLADRG